MFALRARVLEELAALRTGGAEPIATAAHWAALGWQAVLRVLASLLHDLALAQLPQTRAVLRNADLQAALRAAAERLDLHKVLSAQQLIGEYWRLLSAGGSVRLQDLLEDFTIRWSEGQGT
jgi:DNA polymerase III gamma/tau subunit